MLAVGSWTALPLTVPIFFGLPPHRRAGRVFDLAPMVDAAGVIQRVEPLRHNALAAERARVLLHDSAFAAEMLVDCNAVGPDRSWPTLSFIGTDERQNAPLLSGERGSQDRGGTSV